MPHVTIRGEKSSDDEKINLDVVNKNKMEVSATTEHTTVDKSDTSHEKRSNNDDDDAESPKLAPATLNNDEDQQSSTPGQTQGKASEIDSTTEMKSGDNRNETIETNETTGTQTDTGHDDETTKTKEAIMESIETRHNILRQQIESIQRKLTTPLIPTEHRPSSTSITPPLHDKNTSVSDNQKPSKRSESKRLTNSSGIIQHLIHHPDQNETQDRAVTGMKKQSSQNNLRQPPFNPSPFHADMVPMAVLSTTIPPPGRNERCDDDDDRSRTEVELVYDGYNKTSVRNSDPYLNVAAQSKKARSRHQEIDVKDHASQPLAGSGSSTSRQEHTSSSQRKRGLSDERDGSWSNIDPTSLTKQKRGTSPYLTGRDVSELERHHQYDGPNPAVDDRKVASQLERRDLKQVLLTKNEVAQLSHDIWGRLGYASISGKNDVRTGQAKIEIAREFFRRKGYLYLDPNTKYGKTKEKLAYLANATPNDKQRMAILDSKAIKMAVALCERRLYETHGPGATNPGSESTAELPPGTTHPNKEGLKNTNFWAKVSQSWTSAKHSSPDEQRYGERGLSKHSKGETLSRMNRGIPLPDVDRAGPYSESMNKAGTNPNDRSNYMPREVTLSSQEIVELSSKIQRAVVESVQGSSSDNPDFRRIKFMVAHQYFKEKGYLHLPGGGGDGKREYSGSSSHNQHLRNLDNVAVSRAINKCDRYHHEKLMQLSKQSMKAHVRDLGPSSNTSNNMHHANVNPNLPQETNVLGTYPRNSRSVPNAGVPVRNTLPSQHLSERDLNVLMQSKEKELYSALSLVGKSLSFGPWPSPVRPMEPQSIKERNNGTTLSALLGFEVDKDVLDLIDHGADESEEKIDENEVIVSGFNITQAHRDHMFDVVASLKQFTHDVIRPKLLEDLRTAITRAQEDGDGYDNGPLKIFLGTLLMLREIITQNASEIFGPSATLNGNEVDFEGTNASGAYETENKMYAAKVLATSVILYGLSELEESSYQFTKQFLQMVSDYDGGDDSFADYYFETTPNVVGVLPSDQPLSDWESIAWRMSANYNREKHPLIQMNQSRKKRKATEGNGDKVKRRLWKSYTIVLAEPDTVHISILENNRVTD